MTSHVTLEEFSNQFPRLILDARDLPRKPLPFNIMLISVVSRLDPEREYSEGDLNDALQLWVLEFGSRLGVDHANIRRFLIDEGFLTRNPSGSVYSVHRESRNFSFDPFIRDLDLHGMLEEEKEHREERKRKFAGDASS